jgi:hypothetical protein
MILKLLNGCEFDASWLQRRAEEDVSLQSYLFPHSARNNLVSKVDLAWEKSLQNEKDYLNHQIIHKKEEELGDINENYTRAIEAKMEEEARLNKSSFRVMPAHAVERQPQREISNSALRDSLADELNNFRDKLKGQTTSFHL